MSNEECNLQKDINLKIYFTYYYKHIKIIETRANSFYCEN